MRESRIYSDAKLVLIMPKYNVDDTQWYYMASHLGLGKDQGFHDDDDITPRILQKYEASEDAPIIEELMSMRVSFCYPSRQGDLTINLIK